MSTSLGATYPTQRRSLPWRAFRIIRYREIAAYLGVSPATVFNAMKPAMGYFSDILTRENQP